MDEVRWRLDACATIVRRDADGDGGAGFINRDDRCAVTRRCLLAMRRCHADLWLAQRLTNEAFGWTALATVTANFVCLSVNLYWNYVALYFGSNPYWMESLLGSVPLVTSLWTLCWSCELVECVVGGLAVGYLDGVQ